MYTKTWAYLTILVVLLVISSQESILDPLESDLGSHMIFEHALYFSIGALSIILAERFLKVVTAYQRIAGQRLDTIAKIDSLLVRKWTHVLRRVFFLNKYGFIWIAIAASLLIIWHLPWLFNLASESRNIHVLQHISFIAVGAVGFLAIRSLGDHSTIFILFSMAGMMGFSGLVFAMLTERVYLFYDLHNHNTAGAYMIITSIILIIIILPAFIIKRALYHVHISSNGK